MTNEQGLLLNLSTAIGCLTSARNNIEAMEMGGASIDSTFLFMQIVSVEDALNDLVEEIRFYTKGETRRDNDDDLDLDIFFTSEN